jgi:hypothetical protein
MTTANEKKLVLDGKTLPKIYADQFAQISIGATITKVTLATEVDNEIRPMADLIMPTENFVNGLQFMMDAFKEPSLKQIMITDLERLLAKLKA